MVPKNSKINSNIQSQNSNIQSQKSKIQIFNTKNLKSNDKVTKNVETFKKTKVPINNGKTQNSSIQ